MNAIGGHRLFAQRRGESRRVPIDRKGAGDKLAPTQILNAPVAHVGGDETWPQARNIERRRMGHFEFHLQRRPGVGQRDFAFQGAVGAGTGDGKIIDDKTPFAGEIARVKSRLIQMNGLLARPLARQHRVARVQRRDPIRIVSRRRRDRAVKEHMRLVGKKLNIFN